MNLLVIKDRDGDSTLVRNSQTFKDRIWSYRDYYSDRLHIIMELKVRTFLSSFNAYRLNLCYQSIDMK